MRSWVEDEALETSRALGDRLWILEDGTNPWFMETAKRTARAAARGARPRGRERRGLAPRHRRLLHQRDHRSAGRRSVEAARVERKRAAPAGTALSYTQLAEPSRRPASARGRCVSAASRRGGPARPRRHVRDRPCRRRSPRSRTRTGTCRGRRRRLRWRAGCRATRTRRSAARVARTPGVRPARLSRRSARTWRMRLPSFRFARTSARSDQRSWTGARTLRTLWPSRSATRRLSRFLSFRKRFASLRWCSASVLSWCRLSVVVVLTVFSIAFTSFGAMAEIATAGTAAAMPTLRTAIRGAFNGPPHVVVRCRPLSLSQRSPAVTSFVRDGRPRLTPVRGPLGRFRGPAGRVAREIDARPKALPRRCLNPTRGGRPSGGPTGAGRFRFRFPGVLLPG